MTVQDKVQNSRNVLFVKLQTLQKQTMIETQEVIFLPVGGVGGFYELESLFQNFPHPYIELVSYMVL